ncbi:MAG: MFS transporter [Clostridia bacterium]|nr:MFS transporter [Clostridia bacterium]
MEPGKKLWNRNFTIMIGGSVISMLGNAVSGFAIGLLILDYTNSVFLYALTMVLYNLPKIIMPSLSGPFLDKFSRRKAMYVLDFISAGIYAAIAIISHTNQFNYAIVLLLCVIIGTIDSIYMLAYESLFPLLIAKENYTKAYSVSAVIGNIAQIALPLAAIVYNSVGTAPLFAFNAVTFFIAAVFETLIRVNESQIKELVSKYNIKTYFNDFKLGLNYLAQNKGLMYIVLFYTVLTSFGSVNFTLTLPFFKSTEWLGIDKYIYVGAALVLGRLMGSAYHYSTRLKDAKKYMVAVIAFIIMSVTQGTYMLTILPIMILFMFIQGLLSVTTYNLRMSSTQNYVPNELRARFNGTFQTLTVFGGSVLGLIAGALAEYIYIPYIALGGSIIVIIAVYVILVRNKAEVRKIYNHEF